MYFHWFRLIYVKYFKHEYAKKGIWIDAIEEPHLVPYRSIQWMVTYSVFTPRIDLLWSELVNKFVNLDCFPLVGFVFSQNPSGHVSANQ